MRRCVCWRRLLKARTTLVRAEVVMKNQIHALLSAEGMQDEKASLQSKREENENHEKNCFWVSLIGLGLRVLCGLRWQRKGGRRFIGG
jgi:hypothetical protein